MRTKSYRRVAHVILATLTIIAATLPIVGAPRLADAQTPVVVINEFVAANNNGLTDNTNEFEDWIELHNTSASSVDLTGWTIADSNDTFTFAGFTMPANGYRVIFASGDTSRTVGNELHLPFKLSADGEPLILRDGAGTVSSPSFPAPGFPAIPTDISYGRAPGGGLGYFTAPTPGAANSTASGGLVAPVSFSVPHGFYTSTQTVVLDSTTPNTTIRYTLDGSTPTPTSGTVLTPGSSITVPGSSMVRAVAYRTGWIPSNVETRSYFFTSDIINQSQSTPPGWPADGVANGQRMDYGMDPNVVNGNEATVAASLTAIPTISIVTDQANLTNTATGIYVNARSSGIDWERPASVELIDPTGAEPGFDINAGLRIRGGGSRRADNPKHSLRLYFRDEYGDGKLEYPLFGAAGVDTFESVGLRTGQNGSWSYRGEADATWVRDEWARETQAAMGQPNTDSRYYHLYLNGQYWGLYGTQERLSNGHGVEHFGGTTADYDVISGGWRDEVGASDGTIDGWKSLYPIVADLTVTNAEYTTLDANVNLINLADYFLLHYFSGDWDASPNGWDDWANSNNWRAFRNRAGVGGAGKWLFYDHDSEFILCGQASAVDTDNTTPWQLQNGNAVARETPTPAWLHEALLTHPSYQQIFRDRVALHMQTPGGALTNTANQARLNLLVAAVTGAIDAEAARWGDSLGDPANDRSNWDANITALRQCTADRVAVVQGQLEVDGLWPAENPPVISPAAGAVPFGTSVTIDANGEPGAIWYTTDGSDPRGPTGGVSPTAIQYVGSISVGGTVTVRARVLAGTTWTPIAESTFSLSTTPGPVDILVNEYNAVSGSRFLGGGVAGDIANGTDATLGRVAGNGGDWFELVLLEETNLTGYTFETWHLDNGLLERSAALVVADSPELTQLPAGTIVTISEDIPDDLSLDPGGGDWHINLQANNADAGAYFTPDSQQNFATDNDNTQIAIFDPAGLPVTLRTGEGTVADVSVNGEEVFKLEGDPTPTITFDDPLYSDGTSSTWGLPNVWAAGTVTQDLTDLRTMMGDTNCDRRVNVTDALVVAQYTVGTRTAKSSCPIDGASEVMLPAADVNNSGTINVTDALLIAQCSVGLPNTFCPG